MIRMFFIGVAVFTLWFVGKGSYELWGYLRLNATVPAQTQGWWVEQVNGTKYQIGVTYSYEVQGQHYEAKTIFKEPVFLNCQSAEQDLEKWSSYTYRAWYDMSKPQISSLQKIFPLKSCLYAALTLAVFLYLNYKLFRAERLK